MVLKSKTAVNSVSATFTFTHKEGKVVPNFKKWYADLTMIGRHFLVYSANDPHTKRHYTICSTMQPDLLDALRKLGETSMLTFN